MNNIYEKEVYDVLMIEGLDECNSIRLTSLFIDILDSSLAETIDELQNEGIDYEVYMEFLEGWNCGHNRFKTYFRKNGYEDVKFTKKGKELVTKVILGTSFKGCFTSD